MTTNRMGLEQESRLSDEELKRIVDDDHVQCGDASAIASELLACRKASKEPVALVTGYFGCRCVIAPIDGKTVFQSNQVLYISQPLQAVTVPDRIPRIYDEGRFRYVRDGVRFSSNYAKGWNDSIAEMLKSTTNEP